MPLDNCRCSRYVCCWDNCGCSRYLCRWDNRGCSKNTICCLLGQKKLHDFPYLVNHRSYRLKLLDPSKWPQKWVYYGCFRYAYYSDNQKLKKCFFCMLFSWHYVIKFKKALFHKNYISYQIGWPFKMTGRTVFLLLFNTIYTSKTKGNGLKWEFPVFFWMRISGFLS